MTANLMCTGFADIRQQTVTQFVVGDFIRLV